MADDHKKDDKKEEKKGGPSIQLDQSLVDWAVHRFMEQVLPWGASKIGEVITGRVAKAADKPKHFVSFGEALAKLKEKDDHDYEVIKDFMLVGITTDTDRDDFQVRTAKMGGDNVDVTVGFLQLVAEEPDHKSRKEFLESMGIIGERAIDPIERTKLLGGKVWSFFKRRGPQVWSWIRTDADASFVELSRQADAEEVTLQQELQTLLDAEREATRPRRWFDFRR
jgi:hypothetical protein